MKTLQKICVEIERTVWPGDRAFFQDNPARRYWVRPALDIELAEEAAGAVPMPVKQNPPGTRNFVIVWLAAPDVRLRKVFWADIGDEWDALTEAECRGLFEHLCDRHGWWPLAAKLERLSHAPRLH